MEGEKSFNLSASAAQRTMAMLLLLHLEAPLLKARRGPRQATRGRCAQWLDSMAWGPGSAAVLVSI